MEIFFLKEQIRNKDKIIAMMYYYEIDGQLEKMKKVSVQTVDVDRRAATTMITLSKSATITAANPQIQTKSKMKFFRKLLPVKQTSKRRIQSTKTLRKI